MTHTQQRQPADHASSARSGSQRHLLTTDHVPSLSEGVADALQAVPLLLDATYGGQGNATARVAVLQRMQRAYGNRAVQRLLHADQSVHVGPNGQHTVLSQPSGADARVQRAPAPPPSLQDRVSDLERRRQPRSARRRPSRTRSGEPPSVRGSTATVRRYCVFQRRSLWQRTDSNQPTWHRRRLRP